MRRFPSFSLLANATFRPHDDKLTPWAWISERKRSSATSPLSRLLIPSPTARNGVWRCYCARLSQCETVSICFFRGYDCLHLDSCDKHFLASSVFL